MLLDITEVLTHVGVHRTWDVLEPPIEDGDLVCVEPIRGTITFTNTGSALIIGGRIGTYVGMACSRCLAPMQVAIEAEVSEQYPLTYYAGAHVRGHVPAIEEEDTPMAGGLFDGPVMNVTELLRQLLLLAMPTHPLHREDCLGLCPQCGHDLNTGPCNCPAMSSPSPLAGLETLLKAEN